MSNLKGKVLLLSVITLIMISIIPMGLVFGATYSATSNNMKLSIMNGSNVIKNEDVITLASGKTFEINVETTSSNVEIGYYVKADTNIKLVPKGQKTVKVTVPNLEAGEKVIVRVDAIINQEGLHEKVGPVDFYIQVPGLSVKTNGSEMSTSKTIDMNVGQVVSVATEGEVKQIAYKWDSEPSKSINDLSTYKFTVPNFKAGTTHKLQVVVAYTDGTLLNRVYTIRIPENGNTVTPQEPSDDELYIEPWMKESKELDALSVSLRTDTDNEDKANKNIYALGEEVIYYIDYANGTSKDVKDAKLVFETDLDFDIVDAFGGQVDGKKVTWTFPDGIEKEQTGTKILVLKYNSLGKNSVKSKTIYPVANIYRGTKVADSSAVINLIFKDEDTEITNDEHYPYMYGDADATTFRPNDTITRAEGALVLTRIFGMNTSGTEVKNVFSDLNETYPEAQKAIVAATNAGIINGYEDGTYRPNRAMTRAEFMKIIAKYVELTGEDEDIKGLEIKDSTEEIKIYKNPTRSYVVGNSTVNEHWASPYVTFLARLNMTSVSSKEKDLRLDETITRAEVAQLVNFYLLRAPAEVSNKVKTNFSDVNRSHKLYGDIVEATRAAHTYYLTENGKEVVD